MTTTHTKRTKSGKVDLRRRCKDKTRKTVGLLFLDSGAHSLYTKEVIAKGHSEGYSFFESKDFWDYVDQYAAFVKDNQGGIDYYANVDVIFNPKLTWKVQRYLEDEHGLCPVPVVHFGTDLKWLDRYIDSGYTYIGIGGLGQEATKGDYLKWADRAFDMMCPRPSRIPVVRTHGFAMTSYELMLRYPWWSVDSASWAKAAGFGSIYVPHKRRGKFDFSESPYIIAFSSTSPKAAVKGRHYGNIGPIAQGILRDWLKHIRMPLGKIDQDGKSIEYGVLSEYNARAVANLRFFRELCKWLPEWPWPFKVENIRRGFFE